MKSRAKRKQERELHRKAKATAPFAWTDAYDICKAAGPKAIALEYDLDPEADVEEIAAGFARVAYREEVFKEAKAGALAGLTSRV